MSLRYSIYKVQAARYLWSLLRPPRTVLCYHIIPNLSSTFFKFFKFFLTCSLCSRLTPFITQLFNDITFDSICQALFLVFLNFLCYRRCSCGQLAYNSTTILVCQALFYKFCHSFLCVLYIHKCPLLADFICWKEYC